MLFAEIQTPILDRDLGAGSWTERNSEQKIAKYQSVQNTDLLRSDFKSLLQIVTLIFHILKE